MALVDIQSHGAVRRVIMNRAEKHNAIDPEMMSLLQAAFDTPPSQTERVTLLQGNGPSFCSGLQLGPDGVDYDEAARLEKLFDAIQRYPLPVVARVHGKAIAGGCELALHCDFVVAEQSSRFVMPLSQLGVSTTWFLAKKIMETSGPSLAREFLLLGDPLCATRLFELGVIARVAPFERLDAETEKLTRRLAANAPRAMQVMKEMLVSLNDHFFDREYAAFDAKARQVYASQDAREGVNARMNRRTPIFKGS